MVSVPSAHMARKHSPTSSHSRTPGRRMSTAACMPASEIAYATLRQRISSTVLIRRALIMTSWPLTKVAFGSRVCSTSNMAGDQMSTPMRAVSMAEPK